MCTHLVHVESEKDAWGPITEALIIATIKPQAAQEQIQRGSQSEWRPNVPVHAAAWVRHVRSREAIPALIVEQRQTRRRHVMLT